MSARLFIRNVDGDMEEVPTFPTEGWTVEESAEEGSASSNTVAIPDPEMEYDFYSLRRAIIYEDESESDDQVLFSGFVAEHDIARVASDMAEPTARAWSVALVDMNNLWDNRLLVGTDTDRPDETDVERMTWLVATEEMGYFDDLSYLFADDPEDLDARDTARTSVKSVADECSQQSGKNYWIGATGNVTDGTDIFVWYGHDSLEDYESPLRLSNDPADWDDDELAAGTSLVWPISGDSKLHRTGERIYDGVLVEYESGAEYVKEPATTALFTLSGRDLSHPAPEIKTAARAIRRGQRLLGDLNAMDEVLTCTVQVPAAKATMIRAGMRIPVKATHIPGWEEFGWGRIMKCSVTPVAAGTQYRLGLDIQGPTASTPVEGTEVVLDATNGVMEPGNERNASDESDPIAFTAGEVWHYTLTNPQHDDACVTDSLLLSTTTVGPVILGWGANFGYPSWPTGAPDQIAGFPTVTALPEQTGTFVIGGTGTGTFKIQAKAGYFGFPGLPIVDETWHVVLERLS